MILRRILSAAAIAAVLAVPAVQAHEHASHFEGPKQGKHLTFKTLDDIDLTNEFPGGEGRGFRARYWEIGPKGVVPLHDHSNRPAYIYVVQGEIYEHRSDKEEPVLYRAGDLSVEAEGVKHWWENKSEETVVLMGFDIYEKDK
ncbi:MAG: cupin domain-containing protein [Pseudomonadota bacterium]